MNWTYLAQASSVLLLRRRERSSWSLCVEYGSGDEPKNEERSPAELLAVPEADRTKKWRRVGRPAAVNGGLIEQRGMGLWVGVKEAEAVKVAEFGYGGNDDDEVEGGGRRMFILGPLKERERACVF